MFDECQTEAEARVRSRARAVRLPEAVEDEWKNFWSNSLAGIAHDDLDVRVDTLPVHLDPAALGCELHRVREEVPHDLLKPSRVTGHWPRSRVEHVLEPDGCGLGGWPDGIECALDHRPEIDGPDVQAHLPRDD